MTGDLTKIKALDLRIDLHDRVNMLFPWTMDEEVIRKRPQTRIACYEQVMKDYDYPKPEWWDALIELFCKKEK